MRTPATSIEYQESFHPHFLALSVFPDGRASMWRSHHDLGRPEFGTYKASRLARLLMDHPRRVLGGSGRAEAPAQGPEGELRFEVLLRSAGTEPVELENPLATQDAGPQWTGLRLDLAPVAAHEDWEAASVELTPQNVSLLDAQGAPSKARWLRLRPGEEVRLALSRRIRVFPGRYHASLSCALGLHEGVGASPGLIQLDLGLFQVTRAVTRR